MVYYAMTPEAYENLTDLNIRRDEVEAIRKDLNGKYPLVYGLTCWKDREANRQEFYTQRWQYERDFSMLTKDIFADRKAFGEDALHEAGFLMFNKKKADLVRECAEWMKRNGVKEAYVKNFVYSEGKYWMCSQSWYVFEEGGSFFFKMEKKNKAQHLIPEVA